MRLSYQALSTDWVNRLRAGGPDDYGKPAERTLSDGGGNPCRHCLRDIGEGEPMLIAAHRPFAGLQPYAETGPIFLCANPCERHEGTDALPQLFQSREHMLVRGYRANDRIFYGSGAVVASGHVDHAVRELLENSDIAYVHLRSASNNCYQCRVERG